MNSYIILILSVFADIVATSGNYGDITRVYTTGATCQTAQQDRLTYCGVQASRKLAETDLGRMNNLKPRIVAVAIRLNVDPADIAGLISRESRAGNALNNGWGDNWNAWGVMQVDRRYHILVGAWDSEEHINQGTGIFIYMCGEMKKKFPYATKEQIKKAAFAAYNMGQNSVTDLNDVDRLTTGRDYANDVVARAQFYKDHGY